ncbi:MAG: DnaA/Hda family protein [Proteobacteria bacterium]|nr:DnaA/Hda family protein [Pseudomonadota bacterium]
MNMTDQMILDLPARKTQGRADFLITDSNADAVAWLDRWPDWPGHALCLYGPEGSGKSHLLHWWCAQTNARRLTPAQLLDADVTELAALGAVALDNAGPAAGSKAAAEPLLHLYNLLREQGGYLLLAARQPPRQWQVSLPDLRSRLLAAPAVGIQAPDDRLLVAVMAKMFADRQVRVGPNVLSYLATRIERSFAAAETAVMKLDRTSLSGRRPITVPLARMAMAAEEKND